MWFETSKFSLESTVQQLQLAVWKERCPLLKWLMPLKGIPGVGTTFQPPKDAVFNTLLYGSIYFLYVYYVLPSKTKVAEAGEEQKFPVMRAQVVTPKMPPFLPHPQHQYRKRRAEVNVRRALLSEARGSSSPAYCAHSGPSGASQETSQHGSKLVQAKHTYSRSQVPLRSMGLTPM